ncbi:hypothetical protein CH373_04290 [Leptospira perolatii]|uniref:Lipoprotein n=1 Tax=Leptospira perolatii TaxID=2023191 RepID=A0A2M9ZQ21_9LEPT|nr:MXAN_6521/LA_1396 family lipoprotein [Leptospira perolatii]PJZ68987.1 hypothetical protein CH360_13040 [Leptospira perolatii]PJZ74144.1 hypothetical protein CH373_04290 [Leptospira perolatii]
MKSDFRTTHWLSLLALLFLLNQCTVKYVKKDPDLSNILLKFKRIVIVVDPASALNQADSEMAKAMAQQYLAHHKEFIVYPSSQSKFQCGNLPGKAQGIFSLLIHQTIREQELHIKVKGELKDCKSGKLLWEGLAASDYSLTQEDDANQSLRKTYVQKFGESVGPKAIPYYYVLGALVDELSGPTLTEEEQDEKIEVESSG